MTPYEDYLQSPEWKATREKVLRRKGRVCEICGSTENIQVHHISYDEEEFAVLCDKCHKALHEVLNGIYNEECEELFQVHKEWYEKSRIWLADRMADRINAKWRSGIPGPRKQRAASIIRCTLISQKNIVVPPLYNRLVQKIRKKNQ